MNRLCELLDIKYPILQGGMAWVANAPLAAAVSNAGGLGIIAAGNAPKDVIKNEIDNCRKLTDKTFGVNVMLLSPFADDIIDLVIEEKIKVITTMVLIPQIADCVSIPVIAAGGIADGRGIAASFALGAQGVQIGTRFICSDECTAHETYKQMVIKAKDRDAVVTGRITGHPVRTLKNKLSKEFLKMEAAGATPEELESKGVGALRMATIDGDKEKGSFMAGQIAAMIKDIKPCDEILQDLVKKAKEVMPNINL